MTEPVNHEAMSQDRTHPDPDHDAPRTPSRIPSDSPFFTKVLPLVLAFMGLVTTALVLCAIGILLGLIPFR